MKQFYFKGAIEYWLVFGWFMSSVFVFILTCSLFTTKQSSSQNILAVIFVLCFPEEQVSFELCHYVMSRARKDQLFIVIFCIIYNCTFFVLTPWLSPSLLFQVFKCSASTFRCIVLYTKEHSVTHIVSRKMRVRAYMQVLVKAHPLTYLLNLCQSVGKEVFLNSLCKCHQHSIPLSSVNGFVGSPGGSSLGKIIPPKSPPLPLPPPVNTGVPASQKTDLRVVIPQSKGMTLVSVLTAVSKQYVAATLEQHITL